ncbi:MAG: prephenate dehydrogenase/arogenate dehydrogenase family protein [candidate division Zixibacteria bacterium]|nr:prephenate dehydrogenase/arogenate dehydrogenase family protein [candidate division Zixibacteria bacterium]
MSRPPAPAPIELSTLKDQAIGIIGLGQIGGSIVRRLMTYRPEITAYGMDRNTRIAGRVRRYCRWSTTLEDMVRAVDIIVLAVPVPAILDYLPRIADAVEDTGSERLLVIDTGTLKYPVQKAAAKYTDQYDYVGIHPLCGIERNGWDSARSDLFADETVICCGQPRANATRTAVELIRSLGAHELIMDAKDHDRQVALTIGLPHVLAYVANGAAQNVKPDPPLVSSSWQSLVRVTASDPEMVAGFLTYNKTEQQRILSEFRRQLDRLEQLLAQADNESVADTLARWQSPHPRK